MARALCVTITPVLSPDTQVGLVTFLQCHPLRPLVETVVFSADDFRFACCVSPFCALSASADPPAALLSQLCP